jgi:hypothetical protein
VLSTEALAALKLALSCFNCLFSCSNTFIRFKASCKAAVTPAFGDALDGFGDALAAFGVARPVSSFACFFPCLFLGLVFILFLVVEKVCSCEMITHSMYTVA